MVESQRNYRVAFDGNLDYSSHGVSDGEFNTVSSEARTITRSRQSGSSTSSQSAAARSPADPLCATRPARSGRRISLQSRLHRERLAHGRLRFRTGRPGASMVEGVQPEIAKRTAPAAMTVPAR